jgi:hypothetical protein
MRFGCLISGVYSHKLEMDWRREAPRQDEIKHQNNSAVLKISVTITFGLKKGGFSQQKSEESEDWKKRCKPIVGHGGKSSDLFGPNLARRMHLIYVLPLLPIDLILESYNESSSEYFGHQFIVQAIATASPPTMTSNIDPEPSPVLMAGFDTSTYICVFDSLAGIRDSRPRYTQRWLCRPFSNTRWIRP